MSAAELGFRFEIGDRVRTLTGELGEIVGLSMRKGDERGYRLKFITMIGGISVETFGDYAELEIVLAPS